MRAALRIAGLVSLLVALAACESFDRGVEDARRGGRDAADSVGEAASDAARETRRVGRDAADAIRDGLEGTGDE